MNIIKEIRDYRKFLSIDQRLQRQIVFYSGNRFYSQHFEQIIKLILNESDLHIDFITSDLLDPVINFKSDRISFFFCNYLLAPIIKQVKSKVLVMTMTDLGSYHIKRALDPNVNHMYIFHAPASTTMMYRKGAFDNYDTIFCPGPQHKAEIRKTEEFYNLPPKQLIEAGYSLLEKRYIDYQTHSSSQSGEYNTILIAPSWHDNNLVEVCGDILIQTLLDSGYQVVYRPHPQSLISKHRKKKIEAIIQPFLKNENFIFEVNPLDDWSFYSANVLISDWSSISLEYAWGTERPVIFVDTPRKIYNPEYMKIGIPPLEVRLRELIGIVVEPTELKSLPQKVEHLINNKDRYRNNLINSRNKYVYNFGHSSEVIADYIIRYCQNNELSGRHK